MTHNKFFLRQIFRSLFKVNAFALIFMLFKHRHKFMSTCSILTQAIVVKIS